MLRRLCCLLAGSLLACFSSAHAQTAPVPAPNWPTPSATEQAFDAKTFSGLERHIAESLTDISSVVVIRRGRVAFEYYASGQSRDSLHGVESVTKSVLSTLVGIAVAQGRISDLDQPIIAVMPELADANDDPRARQLTVRHLLTMTAGFQGSERRFFDPRERARFAMSRRFEANPGEVFRYDNPASDLLAAVLGKAVGERPAAFARQHLFAPLGIERTEWRVDEQGHDLGHRGLSLRTRDMAKLGQLFLQEGTWQGRQLVPRAYVLAATDRQNAGGPPVGLAYGYLWWVAPSAASRQTFVASGFGGQILWVHAPLDLVVAVTSEVSEASTRRNQAVNLARNWVYGAALKSQAEQPPAR